MDTRTMTMVSRLQSARNSGRSWEVSDEICSHHARTRMADAPHANKRDQATGTISGERRLTVCKIHAVPEPASPRTNRCDPCARGPDNPTATKATTAGTASAAQNGEIAITQIAPLVSGNVTSAFQKLGFKIVINSGVSYSGLCDARTRTVTLKRADNTVYHELGHFVAFVAGNIDTSSAFQSIYNREKSLYTDYNKAYVLSSSSEYFAESYKNYILNPTQLKNSRPETYAAIENALSRVTDAQASRILSVYGALWNK